MKTVLRFTRIVLVWFFLCPPGLYAASPFGDLLKKGLPGFGGLPAGRAGGMGLDDQTIASGLKEALALGTKKAVGLVSAVNGYYKNDAIRILLPDKVQQAAEILGKLGYQRQVDEFLASMNHAAEKAAPKAASFFADAIRGMSIDDARAILSGGDTSATEYFKTKTGAKLYDEFKPAISESMERAAVTRAYRAMMDKVPTLPFSKPESVDLDHHVTTKALDGLFFMVGEEEKKIRRDPVARTTDLLSRVFGN